MKYLKPIIGEYRQNANAKNAQWMKSYMRNQFEFLGLKSPIMTKLNKQFFTEHGFPPAHELPSLINYLWEMEEREFQFFAMKLMEKMKKQTGAKIIDFYEDLITRKSWWDTIDMLSTRNVGYHFIRFPEQIKPYTEKWMESGNFWLQRTALLFQLKYKEETDFNLMTKYITNLMDEKEFFIRKAIGWVLREYSKTNPKAVIGFVTEYEQQLSGLSKREAMKDIERRRLRGIEI